VILSRTAQRLQSHLRGQVGRAIADFGMITPGDRIMVCLSGGKDSYTLLDILLSLQRNAPVDFDLVAVNLDQKQPDFPAEVLPAYLQRLGVPYHIIEQDTYRVVKRVVPEGRTMCGLCSRLRRGALYRYASENGITRIALGHHRDDILETFFLNLFFGGRLKAMAPKLLSDDARHIVIRPLAYVSEALIARYATARGFPIIPCTLCGSQQTLQRLQVKKMLAGWEREFPGRVQTIFAALRNVAPGHLADTRLHDFAGLDALRRSTAAAPEATLDLLAPDRIVPMTLDEEDALAEADLAAIP
jgi:tRNA 2-thiocytidine biosynthesis protein TtcA